jgi:hypothetical protein
MDYSFDKDKLLLGDKTIIILDTEIAKVIRINDIVIVLLDYYKSNRNDNVLAINQNGEIVWRIKDYPHPFDKSAFVDIRLQDDKKILVNNWDGSYVILDPITGVCIEGPIEGK